MNKEQRGFTLIELLVVVAIIGILSGIAFVSISGARESAYDTQIKSELSQVRSNAEQFYYDNGGTYGENGMYSESDGWVKIADEVPPCSVAYLEEGTNVGDNSADSGDIEDATSVYQINVDNQAYAAWAPLCADSEEGGDIVYYCIDSDGNSGQYEGVTNIGEYNCGDIFTNEID